MCSSDLDEDIKVGATLNDDSSTTFTEEDVPEEANTYVPPRPAPRIHHEDGTVTDPDAERFAAVVKEKERLAAQNNTEKETKTANSAENKDTGSQE